MSVVDQLKDAQIGLSSGVSEAVLSHLIQNAPFDLPGDYLDFLRVSNGAEGALGAGYVVLWPAEEVLALNEGLKVSKFAPDLLLIGGDGGNVGLGIDGRKNGKAAPTYAEVDLVGLGWHDVFFTASSLTHMIGHFGE